MSDLVKQNYELAFHISPNLEDTDVQKTKQELEKMVSSHGGFISFSKDPERIRLAYPIKHQTNAYFGYLDFNLENPESANQIRDELRLNPNVLRSLFIKLEEKPGQRKEDLVRRIAAAERRRARAAKDVEKPGVSKTEAPKMGEEAEKALEEKLEEIIEKL